ncbi:hypothetical protein J1N35_007356 [Gossypium stocksii]|uniref:Uncharacterized protein n=1 Tax=Gossypium stocksii TaxID=47602 RepID=A0A9D3W7B2_9ROSI|nr:hypothetical protein J1N35_007356 [Gossypium stocksii]
MLIPRALSSNKAVYENNGRLLPSTAVLGIISNAISGISEPPTICLGTHRQLYWELADRSRLYGCHIVRNILRRSY